jgi:ubiquinone/menaquinone biosynthesis C-methylase UbiE
MGAGGEARTMGTGIFWELHSDLLQQAPGSDELTRQVLAGLPRLGADARILDVGCGPGRQTLVLARETEAQVVAIDLLPPFLEGLRARAEAAGLSDRIEARQMSMTDMPFDDASFDLIWSEGAIYNMGFENGLRAWRRLLRTGGHVAVTEACFLVPEPAKQAADFWAESYPGMMDIEGCLEAARRAGYRVVDHLTLPESAWWDGYYVPLMARSEALRRKYANDPDALAHIDRGVLECELYRDHSASYGYVFFVLAPD